MEAKEWGAGRFSVLIPLPPFLCQIGFGIGVQIQIGHDAFDGSWLPTRIEIGVAPVSTLREYCRTLDRSVAQFGRALGLGPRRRRFKSCRSDQLPLHPRGRSSVSCDRYPACCRRRRAKGASRSLAAAVPNNPPRLLCVSSPLCGVLNGLPGRRPVAEGRKADQNTAERGRNAESRGWRSNPKTGVAEVVPARPR